MSVPASSQRFLAKARGLAVDEVILDLEDAVAPGAKPAARSSRRRAAGRRLGRQARRGTGQRRHHPLGLPGRDRGDRGRRARLDTLILPKVTDPGTCLADVLLGQLERPGRAPGRIGIEAQIEDAAGLAPSRRSRPRRPGSPRWSSARPTSWPRRDAVPAGGRAAGRATRSDAHHYPLMRLLVAAEARGLQAIDGPYATIGDPDGLRAAAASAAALGYDGKWVLHPAQVDSSTTSSRRRRRLRAGRAHPRRLRAGHHASDRRGAVMLDGEMIDEASRKLALAIVARHPGGTTPLHPPITGGCAPPVPPAVAEVKAWWLPWADVAQTATPNAVAEVKAWRLPQQAAQRSRCLAPCASTVARVGTSPVVMRAVCPRCGSELRAPTAWSSAWRCDLHGEIHPLAPARLPTEDGLQALVRHAQVPVWLPWPLPTGWLVSGFTGAGDERTGTRGSALALSGPNPLGGPAEMLIIAEEPGMGLGAGLAGLPGPDPGDGFPARQPNATVKVGNHDAPLWLVESDGQAVFVGEVAANWLWLVLWPDTAGDPARRAAAAARPARLPTQELDVPFGAPVARLPLPALRWPAVRDRPARAQQRLGRHRRSRAR